MENQKQENQETGENLGEVGPGKPPKEYQFKSGEEWRGNKEGRKRGIPNRSTIAKYVLGMKGVPPESILKNLKAMYPKFFETKSQRWSNEMLATIRLAQAAIIKADVQSYNALMNSAYGMPKGNLGLGFDETISGVKIEIKRNDSQPSGDNGI